MTDRWNVKQHLNLRVDSVVRRLFAIAIVALAAVALLILLFGDRSDSPRVGKDGDPATQPGETTSEPTPPVPPVIPPVR